MSTGASWQTLLACLAASYSFGTVFWMNVNLLIKRTKNVPETDVLPCFVCLFVCLLEHFKWSLFSFNVGMNVADI